MINKWLIKKIIIAIVDYNSILIQLGSKNKPSIGIKVEYLGAFIEP